MELLSFSVAGSAYRVDVARVREVVAAGEAVFGADGARGWAEVRGERLPLIDRDALGAAAGGAGDAGGSARGAGHAHDAARTEGSRGSPTPINGSDGGGSRGDGSDGEASDRNESSGGESPGGESPGGASHAGRPPGNEPPDNGSRADGSCPDGSLVHAAGGSTLIVIDGERGSAALRVDAVGEVRDFPGLEVEPMPSYYAGARPWVAGVVVDGDLIATLVDADALVADLGMMGQREERGG